MNKSESKYYNTALLMDEAILLLLEEKDFEFITIKDICKKAGVNRSTFYLHYQNTYELLVEAIEMINKRFNLSFGNKKLDAVNTKKEDLFFITPHYLVPYLNFVKQNKRVFKLIHDKPYLFENKKLTDRLYRDVFSFILDKYGVKEGEKQYLFEFFTQGTLAVVLKWLENDCVDDVDTIVDIIIDAIGYNADKQD